MNKILMINASPRGVKSSSRIYIDLVREHITDHPEIDILDLSVKTPGNALPDFSHYSKLLLVFPLYADSLPGILTALLEKAENTGKGSDNDLKVWAIVNCGFWEGEQNLPALEIIGHFCRRMGFAWQGGVGIGSGAMVQRLKDVPPEAKIRRAVTRELKRIAAEISRSGDGLDSTGCEPDVRLVNYKFPRLLYKLGGQYGWRKSARRNGLKSRDLFARPFET